MAKGKRHIPIRTCIGCGAKRGKQYLIRLVLDGEGTVVRDRGGRGEGRGGYVCSDKSCRVASKNNKRLHKAFRTGGSVSIYPGFVSNQE